MGIFKRKRMTRPERVGEVIELPFWHCIPCGATNSSAFCYLCGRRREDAVDQTRWDRFFTVAAVVAGHDCPTCHVPDSPEHRATALHDKRQGETWDAENTCPDCGDPVEEPFTHHTGCCPHTNIDLAMDSWDPARELTDRGVCADCGAGVYLEHDEDTVYWEVMR